MVSFEELERGTIVMYKSSGIGIVTNENLPISWQSRPMICFISASARIASQALRELLF